MAAEPSIEQIEADFVELLRTEEVGALAVVLPDGSPHVATMHFAGDGVSSYFHTYTYTRKYEGIKKESRVSYTLAHQPTGGFEARMQLRAVQISGIATIVEDRSEIERAIEKCGEQFGWLKDISMFDNFRREGIELRQVFVRIDPVSAMWNDNGVRLLWRQDLTFSDDHKHIIGATPYSTATR